jgi:alanine-synthesizing transaminase
VLLDQKLMSRLDVEAGWYAVLRVPGLKPEEETALDLLLQHGVVVHPGGFFGFVGQGWLVVSLLAREEAVKGGTEALSRHFNGHS